MLLTSLWVLIGLLKSFYSFPSRLLENSNCSSCKTLHKKAEIRWFWSGGTAKTKDTWIEIWGDRGGVDAKKHRY